MHSTSKKILFVFEGKKPEEQISDGLTKFFFENHTIIKCIYGTNFYQLNKQLRNDGDLDLFILLKEKNKQQLENYNRNDFAEIYLFFDYDGHVPTADDDKVNELLAIFNEETEAGKLFISYPMVEALKHFKDDDTFKILECSCNSKYKQIVNDTTVKPFKDIKIYNKKKWQILVRAHLKKMNYIVTGDYEFPNYRYTQKDIFINQKSKYIDKSSSVSVLSAFPVFLYDYFGIEKTNQLLEENK